MSPGQGPRAPGGQGQLALKGQGGQEQTLATARSNIAQCRARCSAGAGAGASSLQGLF